MLKVIKRYTDFFEAEHAFWYAQNNCAYGFARGQLGEVEPFKWHVDVVYA